MLVLETRVQGLDNALGEFYHGTRPMAGGGEGGEFPVFHQRLDPTEFYVGFQPGSRTFQVLSNDQNRFTLPHALPPILSLAFPDRDAPGSAESGAVVTRHAYSEGAFRLLHDLLREGHVEFSLDAFLRFTRAMADVLAFLHAHEIVHGQWNPRSVIAIPAETMPTPLGEEASYRFEVINTGICFRETADVPAEFLEHHYYPPEIFLTATDKPDYGAIDIETDVYCFAAFLKDLFTRAVSSESLASQAARIHALFMQEMNRKGLKATPEKMRQKEQEILDHLYTIKTRAEAMIQEGLRDRGSRATAAEIRAWAVDLDEKSRAFAAQLHERGFATIDVFGGDLQHYTAFNLEVSPSRVNSFQSTEVTLRGQGLPQELVRITLDDRDQGVQVVSASPRAIVFRVEAGFAPGRYKLSLNNRRTNGQLEVVAPGWTSLEPIEVHQPWEGFGPITVRFQGDDLPEDATYSMRRVHEATGELIGEAREALAVHDLGEDGIELAFPPDTEPGSHELCANGLPTGLRLLVKERRPVPRLTPGGLEHDTVKNHRPHALLLSGSDFHPEMTLDLGEDTPPGFAWRLEDSETAVLEIPVAFAPGSYRLHLNHQETELELRVVAPRWLEITPDGVKLGRRPGEPIAVEVSGAQLPSLDEDGEGGYVLANRRGAPFEGSVVEASVAKEGYVHRIRLAADLPRGRPRLLFAGVDTGLQLRVVRPIPRLVYVFAAVLVLAALAWVAQDQVRKRIPEITGIAPEAVFDYGDPKVTLTGHHVQSVELAAEDGARVDLAVEEVEPGRYRFSTGGLAPGLYRIKPVGLFLDGDPDEATLTIRPAALRVTPLVLHRLDEGSIQIHAAEGFNLRDHALKALAFLHKETGQPAFTLPVTADGYVDLPAGRLGVEAEGEYRVRLDDEPLGEVVRVIGPHLTAVRPAAVTLDESGRIVLSAEGQHLRPGLWLGLARAGEEAIVHRLEAGTEANTFAGQVGPGSYTLALGHGDQAFERYPQMTVTVQPPPRITSVEPRTLNPGKPVTLRFQGVGLRDLPAILLRAQRKGRKDVTLPIDARRVLEPDGDRSHSTVRVAGVSLASGRYQIVPSSPQITLEVYDDCRQLVDAYKKGAADEATLIKCLFEERPPDDVRLEAAGLLFDRGRFAEARHVYEARPEPAARFRRSFIDVYVNGKAPEFAGSKSDPEGDPYAVAARRLGWIEGERGPLPSLETLPWELAFAQGLTAADPDAAVAAFERAVAVGPETFKAARVELYRAELDRAVALVGKLAVDEAMFLIEGKLLGQDAIRELLSPEDVERARFWLGHLTLWYTGDEKKATAQLRQAGESEAGGRFAALARRYLAAIDGKGADSEETTGWIPRFLDVIRYYREIALEPNFNLLTERYDFGILLEPEERKKSIAFHRSLRNLEKIDKPLDPFAHFSLLYYLRSAQSASWPDQAGGQLAAVHRGKLRALAIPAPLRPIRDYYLFRAAVDPLDRSQVTVLSQAERTRYQAELDKLDVEKLPAGFKQRVQRLKEKLSVKE